MKKNKKTTGKKVFSLPVFALSGAKKGMVKLNPEVFGVKPNKMVVSQAVRVHLSRRRQGGARAKGISEVVGSKKKIWAQKGSGRARHGSRQAPIFVGGGVAHGPRGVNWRLKMPKKMKRLALLSILSDRYSKGGLVVVDGWESLPLKTKKSKEILEKLVSLSTISKKKENKACLMFDKSIKKDFRGVRNLKSLAGVRSLSYYRSQDAGAYRLLSGDLYLLDKKSIEYFNGLSLKKK